VKHHQVARPVGLLLAAAWATVAPPSAQAQAASDQWQWRAAIYGWLPAIGGSTSFPTDGGGGPGLDVSAKDVLDALKMTFMGQVEARKGQWGLWTDLVYADFGATKSDTRDFSIGGQPASVSATLGLDLKATAWTLAGVYNLTSTPRNRTDVVFGTRLLNLQEKLNWALTTDVPQLPGRSGASSASERNWDAVVGIKGRYELGTGRKWFVPYYADVGGGQSKSTWQANAGLGYRFDWGSLYASYRYLDYRFKSGHAIESMTMNGGLVGAGFEW